MVRVVRPGLRLACIAMIAGLFACSDDTKTPTERGSVMGAEAAEVRAVDRAEELYRTVLSRDVDPTPEFLDAYRGADPEGAVALRDRLAALGGVYDKAEALRGTLTDEEAEALIPLAEEAKARLDLWAAEYEALAAGDAERLRSAIGDARARSLRNLYEGRLEFRVQQTTHRKKSVAYAYYGVLLAGHKVMERFVEMTGTAATEANEAEMIARERAVHSAVAELGEALETFEEKADPNARPRADRCFSRAVAAEKDIAAAIIAVAQNGALAASQGLTDELEAAVLSAEAELSAALPARNETLKRCARGRSEG